MSRSRKKPILKMTFLSRSEYWRIIRRVQKFDVRKMINHLKTKYIEEDNLCEIRHPRSILNDYDRVDWRFYYDGRMGSTDIEKYKRK